MQAITLEGGFENAAVDAARAFRSVMSAMARPGTISDIAGGHAPAPMSKAAATTILTLCDPDTPVFLAPSFDTPEIRAWISFHTGAPISETRGAMFALGHWDALTPLDRFPVGTPEYPDRSTSLIVECDRIEAAGATLSGPGIKDAAHLSLPEIDAFQANHALFPLGLDFIFTAGSQIAALPRSTEVR